MGVVENVKEVADLVKKFSDIELNRKILTLETEVLDLTRDKRRFEEKAEELERTLRLKKDLVFREPYYWIAGDTTPFCPACWEAKFQAVHVVLNFDNSEQTRHDCPSCKQNYSVKKAGGGVTARLRPGGWQGS